MTLGRLLPPATCGLALACAFLAPHAAPAPLLLLNVTPSLPEGLWRLTPRQPAIGEVVALRPPAAAAAAYLRGLGHPADAPLLKRIVAAGEGRVCARPEALQVGDWTIPRRLHDRRGARLPAWSGCRALADDELIVLGSSADSFDSRYFGPVRRAEVLGVYESLR